MRCLAPALHCRVGRPAQESYARNRHEKCESCSARKRKRFRLRCTCANPLKALMGCQRRGNSPPKRGGRVAPDRGCCNGRANRQCKRVKCYTPDIVAAAVAAAVTAAVVAVAVAVVVAAHFFFPTLNFQVSTFNFQRPILS